MLSKVDNNIILNINNLGIVDFDFLFASLHGNNNNLPSRYELRSRLKKRLNTLKRNNVIRETISTINITYYSLSDEVKVILSKLNTRFNYNRLNTDSSLFVHHSNLMRVIAPLIYNFNCFYRTEYMLRDILKGSNIPDFIALINDRKFIFEVERSQKADDLIGGKLSAYNFQFKNDFIIYVTETQSLADKINKMKHAYSNASRIHAFEINYFISSTQTIIADILNKDTALGVSNVH